MGGVQTPAFARLVPLPLPLLRLGSALGALGADSAGTLGTLGAAGGMLLLEAAPDCASARSMLATASLIAARVGLAE